MRAQKRHVEGGVGPTGALCVEQHRRTRDVDQNVLRAHVAVNRAQCDMSSDGRLLRAIDAAASGLARIAATKNGSRRNADEQIHIVERLREFRLLRAARCNAASSSPISVPTAGRTRPFINCAFQFVQRAGSNQPSIAMPASRIVSDHRRHLARRHALRRSATSALLRRCDAPARAIPRATLRRGSARFTQYVLSPASTRHSSDDTPATIGVNVAPDTPREQRFGATRQIGVDVQCEFSGRRHCAGRRPLCPSPASPPTAVGSSRESRGSSRRSAT